MTSLQHFLVYLWHLEYRVFFPLYKQALDDLTRDNSNNFNTAQSTLPHAGNRCHEAKLVESEKAGSCWELGLGLGSEGILKDEVMVERGCVLLVPPGRLVCTRVVQNHVGSVTPGSKAHYSRT